MSWLDREALLIGDAAVKHLSEKKVAVIGLGGVGGATAEGLCRAGIGHLLLLDGDIFDETNLNRQILATRSTIGKNKVDMAEERLLSINPSLLLQKEISIYSSENRSMVFDWQPDYIIDAIDTVSAKVDLIKMSLLKNIPIASSMGAGNRLHPEKLQVGSLDETKGYGDGLSRALRRLLRDENTEGLKVVYSTEEPKKVIAENSPPGRHAPGSISFVPPVAGYLLAGIVVRHLLETFEGDESRA